MFTYGFVFVSLLNTLNVEIACKNVGQGEWNIET